MKTKLLRAAAVILCAAMIFSLAACSSGKIESKSDKLRVVCTLFVPYDFVREIAGDRVDLTLLLPPGMESHSYDPTPADMKAVSNADLLIRVGENMETWSAKLFDKSTGAGEYLDIASEMGLRLAAHEHEHEHGHEDEHEHEHEYEEGFVDAHIWTDPVYAQGMVKVITDALCRLDSRNAEFYKSNSEKYISKLQSLDAGFKDAVKNGKRDIIVFSGRFAFRNFTERYSLNFVSALDACADNSEPGARTVAKIINTVKNGNIPVIFYEELAEPRTAEIICGEKIGIAETDTKNIADKMIRKLLGMRIFGDENGKTNLSLHDIEGSLLLISQFTLYADCRKGNRPSFIKAGNPELANNLYEYIIAKCKEEIPDVQTGIFGADMKISLINDGPFTILLDSEDLA